MKRSMTITIAVFAIIVSAFGGNQAQAQNELLTEDQSGFGVWGGKFSSNATGFSAIGAGIGISDVIEFGFQAAIGDGVQGSGTFTFALHIPTPRNKKVTVGLAALGSMSKSIGFGFGSYMRIESSRKLLLVPMVTAMFYPTTSSQSRWGSSKSSMAISAGGHVALKVSDNTLLTLTPQFSFLADGSAANSVGVSVGVVFFGKRARGESLE